jgi:hypothetical protein
MNHRKILSTAILLVFAESAWGLTSPEYIGTPYENIETKPPKLFKENSSRVGQIKNSQEVDFFKIKNNSPESGTLFPIADVELQFSCPQSKDLSGLGWYISVWVHYADTSKADQAITGYDYINSEICSDKFQFYIEQNESYKDVDSYYIGVQSACADFPSIEYPNVMHRRRFVDKDTKADTNFTCDTSNYRLTLGSIPKEVVVDTSTLTTDELKNSTPLGSIISGQIQSEINKNVYSVETYATTDKPETNDVPLLFSCTAAAARQTNDWKLTVYDDKNKVVDGYPRFINGSDCGSTLVDDKGGFKFTLPKNSPRYFVSVQSACDSQSKKNCTVEQSPYNIARDVTKIYTSVLATGFKADATSFKLNRCGLNNSSTLSVTTQNITGITLKQKKTPIKIQIGTMACQVLTQQSFNPAKDIMLGSITGNAEIIDYPLIAKDSATITLSECVSMKDETKPAASITLTGTKLDLENLNPVLTTTITTGTTATGNPIVAPTTVSPSVAIPVKVDIGDFHCEGKDAFYVNADKPKVGDTTYSNDLPTGGIITPYTKISTEKFSELSVGNRLEAVDKVDYYPLTASPEQSTSLDFSCTQNKAIGGENGWVVTVWEQNVGSVDWLEAAYSVMPTDCGNNGAFKMTVPSSKNPQYIGVQSSCLPVPDDSKSELNLDNVKTCKVNTSSYSISPIIIPPPPPPSIDPNAFKESWFTTKKNLGATSQTGQINTLTDAQIYQVDTGTEDANLTFSCLNSVRYQNDWKVLIYDSTQTLKSTTLMNGSSCGMGKAGDTGAYPILLTKDSPSYYLVVKSACDISDAACVIDSSQYQLKRVTPAQAVANEAAKPCFGTGCTTTKPVVKPFFNSPK